MDLQVRLAFIVAAILISLSFEHFGYTGNGDPRCVPAGKLDDSGKNRRLN